VRFTERLSLFVPSVRIILRLTLNQYLINAAFIRWDEKAGLRGMRYAPNVRRAQGTPTPLAFAFLA
jgi:hypothetical protein